MTTREVVPPPDIRLTRGDAIQDRVAVLDEKTGKVVGTVEGHRIQSRLERMHRRGEITERDFIAGERFALDVEALDPGVRSALDPSRSGGEKEIGVLRQGAMAAVASIRVRKALTVMGPVLGACVVWVSVFGRPASDWARQMNLKQPQRTGVQVLILGLQALAKEYKLDSECHSEVSNP